MIARAARDLLREVAVLLTALAFIMSGALAPRQHAEAAVLQLATGNFAILCHPEGGAANSGDPAQLPGDHVCDQCVTCHLHGVATGTSELPIARDWQVAARSGSVSSLLGAARAALPFATGPPRA